MTKRGRPSDYSFQVAISICARLAEGKSLRAICSEAGTPGRATVFRWIGGALGVNRHLHKQPSGLRTLSLVGLGSALAVTAVTNSGEINAISRIVQGVLTGVGFLGAGVIFRAGRRPGEHNARRTGSRARTPPRQR
jgi:hypothetical protein